MKIIFIALTFLTLGCRGVVPNDIGDVKLRIDSSGGQPIANNELYKLRTNEILPVEIIEASILYKSPVYKAERKFHISYELTILNGYKIPFKLDKIEVYNAESQKLITQFDEEYLRDHFVRHGLGESDKVLELSGNQFGIANLVLTLGAEDSIPHAIYHKLIFEIINKSSDKRNITMEVALMVIPSRTDIELGLPFKKGIWLYGASSHRDSRYITEGRASYPQRYAIDWTHITDDGYFVEGDIGENKNWISYGVEIIAVADGKVVDTKDGIIENDPSVDEMAVRMTRETVVGNYVVLDIGNNTNAVYAHLIPNSLRVKIGDSVKKGQVLGLLGNSGNSDSPHLHFHLETKHKLTLGGEGVPYYFKEFSQLNKYTDDEFNALIDEEKIPLGNNKSSRRLNELPVGNGLIKF